MAHEDELDALADYLLRADIPLTVKHRLYSMIPRPCVCCGDRELLTDLGECVPCSRRYDDDREIGFHI